MNLDFLQRNNANPPKKDVQRAAFAVNRMFDGTRVQNTLKWVNLIPEYSFNLFHGFFSHPSNSSSVSFPASHPSRFSLALSLQS